MNLLLATIPSLYPEEGSQLKVRIKILGDVHLSIEAIRKFLFYPRLKHVLSLPVLNPSKEGSKRRGHPCPTLMVIEKINRHLLVILRKRSDRRI